MHEFIFFLFTCLQSLVFPKESENITHRVETIVNFSLSNLLCLKVLITILRGLVCYELWWNHTAELC